MIGETVSHYRILGKLGAGGMGEVFEAEDLQLGRHVALKFLSQEMAHHAEALHRFEREARAASALNHPNICTVHDIGRHQGAPFMVMELLTGRSLKQLIPAGGMRSDEIVELGLQVADALAAAHRAGIIHRDVKPANVVVTEQGIAKLLDFGLAKHEASTGEKSAGPDRPTVSIEGPLTSAGHVIGTVSYMSPEQARGRPLDARSDLFSMGVLLYEMATGVLPFSGAAPGEVLEAILLRTPSPPLRLNPALPPQLDDIINKALEKDPALRYQSGAELKADLLRLKRDSGSVAVAQAVRPRRRRLWLMAIAAMTAAAAVGAWWVARRQSASPAPSIAVLPFADLSPGHDQEHLSDGLADELINRLATVRELRVVGRTSSFQFKGKSEDLRVIGEKLSVETLLEGSVRKQGDRVRITTQLVNAADGLNLWSETYDREVGDLFVLQDDIAQAVARSLRVTLLKDASAAHRSTNPEAYNAYLQARYFYERGHYRENLARVVTYAEQAIKLDPDYAPAWPVLARARLAQASDGHVPAEQGWRQAREAIETALRLDPNLADAHAALGWLKLTVDWDWGGAKAAYDRALAAEPHNPLALRGAGAVASVLGRLDEAVVLTRRAVELEPLGLIAHHNLGGVLYYAGRYDEAEAAYRKVMELQPQRPGEHATLAEVYVLQGHAQEALDEAQKDSEPFWRTFALALAHHALQHKQEADAALAELIDKYAGDSAFQIAEVYAFRGDADRAFEWLHRAYRQRDAGLAHIKVVPPLRSIRGDPRYVALLDELGLPP